LLANEVVVGVEEQLLLKYDSYIYLKRQMDSAQGVKRVTLRVRVVMLTRCSPALAPLCYCN
jgi:hypothetical protein